MAGVSQNDVYLLGPDQSSSVGAIYKAATSATGPTDARTALGTGWSSACGYLSEAGITLNINRSTTTIKDWGLNVVRVATTDFGTQITGELLQMDGDGAKFLFGDSNVTVTAATTTKPETVKVSIGPSLPDISSFCFNMKDGDQRVRLALPNAQPTIDGELTFKANEPISWSVSLDCGADSAGKSIYFLYDNGVLASATTTTTGA